MHAHASFAQLAARRSGHINDQTKERTFYLQETRWPKEELAKRALAKRTCFFFKKTLKIINCQKRKTLTKRRIGQETSRPLGGEEEVREMEGEREEEEEEEEEERGSQFPTHGKNFFMTCSRLLDCDVGVRVQTRSKGNVCFHFCFFLVSFEIIRFFV